MDGSGHEQHPDLAADVGQRLGQGLAVLATLGEAMARLAAEEMHRKQRREEQAERFQERLRTERASQERKKARKRRKRLRDDELARRAERRRVSRIDRRIIAQTLDPDWLARADLLDLATVWRTARVRETEFPEAGIAAAGVEQRLREVYPRPMHGYDQAVAGGASRGEAMRAAAWGMARTRPARPHDGSHFLAVGSGRQPSAGTNTPGIDGNSVEEFQAVVRQEQMRLADLAPQGRQMEDLERLGAGGSAAAQALREALAAQAEQELLYAQADAATPDDVTTENLDEHVTAGLPRNARHLGDANHDQADARTAAQLAAEWYPEGLHQSGVMPAHVAGRRPANAARTRAASGERHPVRTR